MNKRELKILEAFGEPIADGGQEAFVFGVMKHMDMTGLKIDCLTAYDCQSKRYNDLVESLGGKVYALKLPFAPGKSRMNIARPFKKFLQTHRYDIVHVHSGSISALAIMASVADQAGVEKVIVHSHATGRKDSVKHKVLRYLASLSMRKHVDVYCACSQKAADWKFEPKYSKQAKIIKNGIDIQRFAFDKDKRRQMRYELGINDQTLVIGHVGRFTAEKNQKFLIEVFKELQKIMPDSKLLLVGDGEMQAKLQRSCSASGIEDKVIFTGSVTNAEDYLMTMDVFVMPSLFEGLGIAAVEAQAAGLPVYLSDRIPSEVLITGVSKALPLKAGPQKWADEICKAHVREREKNLEQFKDSDFLIANTAIRFRRLYT